jgi:hypothetical protein
MTPAKRPMDPTPRGLLAEVELRAAPPAACTIGLVVTTRRTDEDEEDGTSVSGLVRDELLASAIETVPWSNHIGREFPDEIHATLILLLSTSISTILECSNEKPREQSWAEHFVKKS